MGIYLVKMECWPDRPLAYWPFKVATKAGGMAAIAPMAPSMAITSPLT
jgi:hypothetical protein